MYLVSDSDCWGSGSFVVWDGQRCTETVPQLYSEGGFSLLYFPASTCTLYNIDKYCRVYKFCQIIFHFFVFKEKIMLMLFSKFNLHAVLFSSFNFFFHVWFEFIDWFQNMNREIEWQQNQACVLLVSFHIYS